MKEHIFFSQVYSLQLQNLGGSWRKFNYDDITPRDNTGLDIFWLKNESLRDLENHQERLESFREIIIGLNDEQLNYIRKFQQL
jgi:hypothetical protein